MQTNFTALEDRKSEIMKKGSSLTEFIESNKRLASIHEIEGKNIGDKYQKADFSKSESVKEASKLTYEKTNKYIEDTENDIKNDPLLTEKDDGYLYYLEYNKDRKDILKFEQNTNYKQRLKCYAYFISFTVLIAIVIIFIVKFL